MNQDILFTENKHIGFITLNRTRALNALTFEMIEAIYQKLSLWQADDKIHAVVVKAAPGRAFCAGGDVRWVYDVGRADYNSVLDFFAREYRLNLLIHNYKKPYIAFMDGITMGGGVGISLHGSHSVATENFVFAMPETAIGFFPDIGASYFLSKLENHIGIYLGLSGRQISAQDARSLGLVKHLVDAQNVEKLIENLSELDLSTDANARVSAYFAKEEVEFSNTITKLGLEIDNCFKHQDIESIMDCVLPDQKLFAELMNKSPLSLKVTLAQLLKARTLDLADCLKMDYVLVGHFLRGHDFYEGVRALLIDKDKLPNWQYKSYTLVDEEVVASYFS